MAEAGLDKRSRSILGGCRSRRRLGEGESSRTYGGGAPLGHQGMIALHIGIVRSLCLHRSVSLGVP